jgi:2-methylcitrate dehydratase PrpD
MDQGDGIRELVIDHPLGDVANPMTWDQVTRKFTNIGRISLSDGSRQGIISAVGDLHTVGFAPLLAALDLPQAAN